MLTLKKKDWARLRWSIVLLLAMTVAGIVIVSMANEALNNAAKANQQATVARNSARSKAAMANQEAQELREKIVVYRTLEARGIIGEEHRLDWIEKIGKIKKARKLIDVTYELAPQKRLDATVVQARGNGFDIMASPMTLQMALLHENDLLDFLSDLRADIQGYIRIRQCDISRVVAAAADHGPAAQLRADCEIEWITLREKQ